MRQKLFSKISVLAGLSSAIFLLSAIALPSIVFAQTGSSNAQDSNFQLVPCDAPPISYTDAKGNVTTANPVSGAATTPCDFAALMLLVQRIINFLIYAATFIAVISIVYAGFLYLTAGPDTGKVKRAHEIFKATVIGFAIALCSWLVVYTVINAVIRPAFETTYPGVTNLLGKQ